MRIRGLLLNMAMSTTKSSPNYYKLLEVSSSASEDQIKKAFKKLAKKYHPDANGGREEQFKAINEAYRVLSSKQSRKDYDEQIKQASQSSQSPPPRQKRYDPNETFYGATYKHDWHHPKAHEFRYSGQDPRYSQQAREFLRRRHEQDLRRAGSRANINQDRKWQEFGSAYEQYQQFAKQKMRQKAAGYRRKPLHQQDDEVNQQTVRMQYEKNVEAQRLRQEAEIRKQQEQLEKEVKERFERAKNNAAETVQGLKRMGSWVKDMWESQKGKK